MLCTGRAYKEVDVPRRSSSDDCSQPLAGKTPQCSHIFKMPINVRSMERQDISPVVLQSSNSISPVKTSAMASSSMQPARVTKNLTLKPDMTLKGHEEVRNKKGFVETPISSISYLPDGKGMVSASYDKTTRQWDLQTGKEIEEARDVCEQKTRMVALSPDGRWVVTSSPPPSPYNNVGELEVRDIETRIVKTFESHSHWPIHCIDVSADGTLLVGGSWDGVRIWCMETGKLVAGLLPCDLFNWIGRVQFSQDSKKFAISGTMGGSSRLEVWDVQTQKLDVGVEKSRSGTITNMPIFWTTKDKSIVAVFDFNDKDLNTIYEFDALTLEIVGAPFEHTHTIYGLTLSFDCALIASASRHTVKLWAFESRQLLASFDDHVYLLILSPNSHQLAYVKWNYTNLIYIYDLPPDILSSVRPAQNAQPETTKNPDLLNSDATPRRKPVIVPVPRTLRPLPPTTHPKQHLIRYLRKILPFRTHAGPPIQNDEPHDPLDFPATSPLPRSLSVQAITQRHSNTDSRENSRSTPPPSTTQISATTTFKSRLHQLSTWWPVGAGHAPPPVVITPLAQGKERNAAAGAPKKNKDYIPDEEYIPSRPSSPDPHSQQPPAAAPITTKEHGSGRLCGCF